MQGDDPRFCLIYQARHRVDGAGHDEVAFTFTPVGHEPGEDVDPAEFGGRIIGVRPTETPQQTWRLDALDFSAFDPDRARCAWDEADPCAPQAGLEETDWRRCQLYWPHDFQILEETADGLRMVVADTRNERVVWLTLPTGSTCGVVEDVLDGANPAWDIYTSVNSIQTWTEETDYLLMSIKDTTPAQPYQGGDGRGRIVLWRKDQDWTPAWIFPPVDAESPSFVNAPHGVVRWEDHVMFAHSLGRSDDWNTGEGGSFGVLGMDGTYRFDLVLPDDPLRFPRDIDPLGDGRFLLVDSGSKGEEVDTTPTAAWVVEITDWSAGTGTGAWSADGANQTFREIAPVGDALFTDAQVLYSGEAIGAVGEEWERYAP